MDRGYSRGFSVTDHLFERLIDARTRLDPVRSKYRVAFEDPDELDGTVRIMGPDLHWMAAARHGGILPVCEAYHKAVYKLTVQFPNDRPVSIYVRGIGLDAARSGATRQGAKILSEIVVHAPWHTAERMGPMTEFEAIDYLIQKDMDYAVWGAPSNRQRFKVVKVDDLPEDRSARNAWELT